MEKIMYCKMIYLVCGSLLLINMEASGEKLMFVFGDSFFDAGNNQYYFPENSITANRHPYGMSMYTATGRYSDGLLVPDFIAKYAGMPTIPPALEPNAEGKFGYNFASAGSGVYYDVVSLNLEGQLSVYMNVTITKQYGSKLQEAVYLFSTGGNDYMNFVTDNDNATTQEMQHFVDYIVNGIKQAIQVIYETGGRKFAFENIGLLGCSPGMKYNMGLIDTCYEKANTIARLHNVALSNMFQNLTNSEQYQDIKYGIFDYYTQILLRLSNHTNYGFKEKEIACCGYGGKVNGEMCGSTSVYFLCTNPSAFIFFDAAHNTQAVNSQLSNLMWIGDQTYIYPYNVKQLFNFSTTHTIHVQQHEDHLY